MLTVKDLIEELKKMPQHKEVWIGSPSDDFGKVERVVNFEGYVDVQSDYEEDEE